MIHFYLVEKVLEFLKKIHSIIKNRLKIPMIKKKRSLNIASSVAIVLAENLRQNKFINHE